MSTSAGAHIERDIEQSWSVGEGPDPATPSRRPSLGSGVASPQTESNSAGRADDGLHTDEESRAEKEIFTDNDSMCDPRQNGNRGEIAGLLAAAGERSSRRVEVIRGVLKNLRPVSLSDQTLQADSHYCNHPDSPVGQAVGETPDSGESQQIPRVPRLPLPLLTETQNSPGDLEDQEDVEFDHATEDPGMSAAVPRQHVPPPMPVSSGRLGAGGRCLEQAFEQSLVSPRENKQGGPMTSLSMERLKYSRRRAASASSVCHTKSASPSETQNTRSNAHVSGRHLRPEFAEATIPPPQNQRHWNFADEKYRDLEEQLVRAEIFAESEIAAAKASHDALNKAEAEVALAEGNASRRDVQLRSEMLDMRGDHQKERERLRVEVRRVQAALKDSQTKARSEGEGKAAASEQVEALSLQLASAKTELQKRSKEWHEAKTSFTSLEEKLHRHDQLFKWAIARCAETLKEDPAQDPYLSTGITQSDTFDDSFKRVLARTLTLLAKRSRISEDDKENIGINRMNNAGSYQPDAANRLATTQGELLHARVENEELEASHRRLRARLTECEQSAPGQAHRVQHNAHPHSNRGPGVALRTEHRCRIRAAEEEAKRLQRLIVTMEENADVVREEHEENLEMIRARLAGLQRAKEAGERYTESEEDTWLAARKEAHSEVAATAEMRNELRMSQLEAGDACADAVQARAVAHAAEATHRRLEADVSELKALNMAAKSAFPAAVPVDSNSSGLAASSSLRENQLLSELRFRDQVCVEEAMKAQSQTQEWHATLERANMDIATLRKALENSADMVRDLEARCEEQQVNQVKVDEAKRGMIHNVLEEQERKLRGEFYSSLEASRVEREEEIGELRKYSKELRDKDRALNQVQHSVVILQQEVVSLQLQVQQEGLLRTSAEEACLENEASVARETSRCGIEERAAEMKIEVERLTQERLGAEIHDLRRSEQAARHIFQEELDGVRAVHAALAEAAHAAARGEEEESKVAQKAARKRSLSARGQRVAFREEVRSEVQAQVRTVVFHEEVHKQVRNELQSELEGPFLAELEEKIRSEVEEDVRRNPCSELRKELCRDLRQELRDQMRSESHASGLTSRPGSSPSSSPQTVKPSSAAVSPAQPSVLTWVSGNAGDRIRGHPSGTPRSPPPSSIAIASPSLLTGGASFLSAGSRSPSPSRHENQRNFTGWPVDSLQGAFAQAAGDEKAATFVLGDGFNSRRLRVGSSPSESPPARAKVDAKRLSDARAAGAAVAKFAPPASMRSMVAQNGASCFPASRPTLVETLSSHGTSFEDQTGSVLDAVSRSSLRSVSGVSKALQPPPLLKDHLWPPVTTM